MTHQLFLPIFRLAAGVLLLICTYYSSDEIAKKGLALDFNRQLKPEQNNIKSGTQAA
jgi:hypothetical protein